MYAELIATGTPSKGPGIESYCWGTGYKPTGNCYGGGVPYGWCVFSGGTPSA
jgi:hypothetical protein